MEFEIVRMLHIAFMALWLASIIKGMVYVKSVKGMRWIDENMHKRANRIAEIFGIVTSIGTVFFGGYLMYLAGGFEGTDWPIHFGMTLAVIMVAIGAFRIGPLYHDLADDLGMHTDQQTLETTTKKLNLWYFITLLLWVVCFLLMIFRHGF